MQHVKIPQDRIGVLIGEGGETMREIEAEAEVRLDIDSENGSVAVETVGDPVLGLKGPEIVPAPSGADSHPRTPLRLLEDDMMLFDVVDIDAASRNKTDMKRKKGRLIGESGRTRELMEELTGADVVIYGSTLGIIGGPQEVEVVRSAAEMLSMGHPTARFTPFLEEKHNEMKHKGMEYHRFPGAKSELPALLGLDGLAEDGASCF